MTAPLTVPNIQVPGLLPDDALREQLKQFTNQQKDRQGAAPPPSSAVDFTQRIQREFLDQPVRSVIRAQPAGIGRLTEALATSVSAASMQAQGRSEAAERRAAQDRAIDLRSRYLSEDGGGVIGSILMGPLATLFSEQSPLARAGTLTPEESQQIAEERATAAQEQEAAVRSHVDTRRQMRDLTNEQLEQLGMPIAPGSEDPNFETQIAEEEKLDVARVEAAAEATAEAAQAVEQPELQPQQTWWLDMGRSAVRSMGRIGTGALKTIPIAWELTPFSDGERTDVRAWIDTVDVTMEKLLPPDKARSKDFLSELGAAGGSMAGYMILGTVGMGLGLPAGSSTVMLGASTGATSQFEDAERFNAAGTQKLLAFLAGGALGMTEAIPINRMLLRAELATGGLVSRMLQQTAAGSMEEFLQEFGQSVGADVIAKWTYDANRDINLREAARDGLIGGLVGGMAASATGALHESGVTGRPPPERQPDADPVADEAAQESILGAAMAEKDMQIEALVQRTEEGIAAQPPDTTLPQIAVTPDQETTVTLPPVEAAEQIAAGLAEQRRPATEVATELVQAFNRPSAVDVGPTVQARGGTMPPTNENGNIVLKHWSPQRLDVIDPAFQGTGPLRGAERQRLFGPDAVQRAYYGVQSGAQPVQSLREFRQLTAEERQATRRLTDAGVSPQRVQQALEAEWWRAQRQLDYQAEGQGPFLHEVEVSPEDLYNWNEDPLELRAQIPAGIPATERATRYERLIQEAGFRGAYAPSSDLGQTAILFEPAEPVRVFDERTAAAPAGEAAQAEGEAVQAQEAPAETPLDFDPEVVTVDPSVVEIEEADLQPLPGNTQGRPIERVVRAARAYAVAQGLPIRRQAEYVRADPERGARIAEAYEQMEHNPEDPAVAAAYQAMIEETLAQYQYVKASGIEIEFIEPGQPDPYPGGPREVLADLERGHLWVFPTDQGFGTLAEAEASNPLLAPTDEFVGDRRLLANDVFRIVHDFFGHGIEGSGFGARGEENAWQSHMRLYTEAALPAVTSETRGQNSWVNFGPFGEQNRANMRETTFADQKTGIMPPWTWSEGVADDTTERAADQDALLAATASGRGPFRAEQARPRRGLPGQPDASAAEISLSRIAQNVIRILDLTARQGRLTLRGSAVMGQYSGKQNTVRLRTWNDLSTLVHEGGHALEKASTGQLKKFVSSNSAALAGVARKLYGGDVGKLSKADKASEGFAEFFRVYVLNRNYAEAQFTDLTQKFDDLLDQTAPEMREGLDLIREQHAAWLQLPSATLVRNMVVSGRNDGPINEALGDIREGGFGTWFHEIVRQKVFQPLVNRNAAINDLVSEILNLGQQRGQAVDLKRAEDPRVLIRLATHTGNRAMVQTTDGVMGYRSVDPSTRGLREALLRYHGLQAGQNLSAIDPERQTDFAAYLISLRGIDEYRRYAEGKIERPPVAATLGDLRTVVREMNAKYGNDFVEAAQIVHEFGMALWQKAFDAGLVSPETYASGMDRQFYVPLQRDLSDRAVTTGEMRATQGQSIVRRFRGSDRDIIDPMDALMQKTFSLERVIAENDAKKALASLADKVGQAGALVERIPAQQLIGQQFTVQEVARQLTKDSTMSEADAQDLMELLEASVEEGNRIALFRSEQAVAKGENIMFFWEHGKLAAIQLKDGEIGADVVNTMNGTGRETMPLLTDLLAYTSSTFRSAITSWPDFLMVNFIRDQVSAWILTEGYTPFATGLRGVGDELRQTQWARQYNAAMGIMGGMNTAALHKARVDRDISALRKKGYLVRAFQDPGLGGKIRGLARVTEMTETGTRLGIFRQTFNRAKKDGLTDWEASIEASYTATDYIDFSLNGNQMLMLRRTIPFLNAQLQGFYKMMRVLGGDEVRQRQGLMFAMTAFFKDVNNLPLSRTEQQAIRTGRKAWLKMLSLGFIGAALAFGFKDDPDYQDASEYLRTTGWVIPLGDGEIVYIPKPFELAVVSNFVERGIEHASGDGEAMHRFLRGMAMNLTPPTSPPLIQVAVEEAANFDFFGGREIVPDYMRALSPELQYNHYTSELAKNIGEITGWSPMRVDHVLSGLGASAYRDISGMYNMADPERPETDKTDWPVTRRFVRDARRGAASAQDFWNYASTVDGSLRRAELTYRRYLEEGRENASIEYLSTLEPEEHAYAVLNAHFKADVKRLNPFYRGRQLSTIVSGMRREMVSPLGIENTQTKFSESIKLSAREKAQVDTALSEFIRREIRNTLIYMDAPGWRGKKPLRTETTLDLIRQIDPRAAEELNRRITKAKVYSGSVVQEYWPEARDRLIRDHENTFLKDIVAIAKVTR